MAPAIGRLAGFTNVTGWARRTRPTSDSPGLGNGESGQWHALSGPQGKVDGCHACCATGIHVEGSSATCKLKLTYTLMNGGIPGSDARVQWPQVGNTCS